MIVAWIAKYASCIRSVSSVPTASELSKTLHSSHAIGTLTRHDRVFRLQEHRSKLIRATKERQSAQEQAEKFARIVEAPRTLRADLYRTETRTKELAQEVDRLRQLNDASTCDLLFALFGSTDVLCNNTHCYSPFAYIRSNACRCFTYTTRHQTYQPFKRSLSQRYVS